MNEKFFLKFTQYRDVWNFPGTNCASQKILIEIICFFSKNRSVKSAIFVSIVPFQLILVLQMANEHHFLSNCVRILTKKKSHPTSHVMSCARYSFWSLKSYKTFFGCVNRLTSTLITLLWPAMMLFYRLTPSLNFAHDSYMEKACLVSLLILGGEKLPFTTTFTIKIPEN